MQKKIIQNRTLDLSQIIAEFKHRYELDLKETELLKILSDLTERGELESTKQDNRKLWSIKK
ncbi:hypothetical protein [Methanosarcina barkeri]|uniref:hypothetical protein n=1 Tax=Methanosarcina barkeri TaxID=2208 RepID=UPI000B16E619|nr:hypothetical protein [Methanosarcina barkeri]